MYEFKNGAFRLSNALSRYSEDDIFIKKLSQILNYDNSQLIDDIKALNDYLNSKK